MKRFSYFVALVLLGLVACKGKENKENASQESISTTDSTSVQETGYTCPMHPEVVSDKAGTCPECGMDLEAKS